MTIKRNAEGKVIVKKFTLAQLKEADNLMTGFCRWCGHEQDCVEPDARGYECESCENPKVFGAQEIMMMPFI